MTNSRYETENAKDGLVHSGGLESKEIIKEILDSLQNDVRAKLQEALTAQT